MGSQSRATKNMPKKEVKGDLQNVKHIKLKLHNVHDDVSFEQFNLNFIHLFPLYIYVVVLAKKTEIDEERCVVCKTYYRMPI